MSIFLREELSYYGLTRIKHLSADCAVNAVKYRYRSSDVRTERSEVRIFFSLYDSYMYHKTCRPNWQRNTNRSNNGKILPGEQPTFRISSPRRCFSCSHKLRVITFGRFSSSFALFSNRILEFTSIFLR